jgi:hypothetical protein
MDRIKKLALKVRESKPGAPRRGKSNRTMALTEPEFSTFQKYCRSKGRPVSEVVDELIALFLEEVADDLPPDLSIRDEDSA